MSTHDTTVKRTRIRRICRSRVFIVALLLFGGIFPFALPLVVSAGWHATHSSVQRYGDYDIRVPWPYFLLHEGDSAWLMRMRAVPDRRFYRFAVVSVMPRSGRLDVHQWRNRVVRAFEQHGVNVAGSFDASMGGVPMACIEQTVNKPEFKYFVMCRGGDGSRIEYMGDTDGLRQFKSVLGGITVVGK